MQSPHSSNVITTSTRGLKHGTVQVPVHDGSMEAYHAMPDREGRFPVVLVVQEIFGLHEHIRDICRRFAQEGYLAIAPQLYQRQGDASQYSDIPVLIEKIVSKVPDEQVMQDLDACLVWAGLHGGDLSRVAVTGYCWGGRITWLYAAHQAKVKAGVAWYGRLVTGHGPLQKTHPIDVTDRLHAPVLGLYGGKDAGIPMADVQKMREHLYQGNEQGKASDIHVYQDAEHAFYADYRPSYLRPAADDAWKRCLAWMDRHLG